MQITKQITICSLVVIAGFTISGSLAQDAGSGNLGQITRQQDLDSYWLDSRMWTEYGYRPHIKANIKPFTSLPSYTANTGLNYYSYGMVQATPPDGEESGPGKDIQISKYGTWR